MHIITTYFTKYAGVNHFQVTYPHSRCFHQTFPWTLTGHSSYFVLVIALEPVTAVVTVIEAAESSVAVVVVVVVAVVAVVAVAVAVAAAVVVAE